MNARAWEGGTGAGLSPRSRILSAPVTADSSLPAAECHCRCCKHGISDLEDREAAIGWGYDLGFSAGRLQNVADEVRALLQADASLSWLNIQQAAYAKGGAYWASLVAGPMPGGAS